MRTLRDARDTKLREQAATEASRPFETVVKERDKSYNSRRADKKARRFVVGSPVCFARGAHPRWCGEEANLARKRVKRAAAKRAVKKRAVKRAVKKRAVKKAVKRRAVKKAVKRRAVKKAVKRRAVKRAVVKRAVRRAVIARVLTDMAGGGSSPE
jgi:DNA-binding protein HU-beta